MLVRRLRRWPNIKTALVECPVFAGMDGIGYHVYIYSILNISIQVLIPFAVFFITLHDLTAYHFASSGSVLVCFESIFIFNIL